MNLSKRLLLLKHLNNFIIEQHQLGQTTEDILGMLRYKATKYSEKEREPSCVGQRKIYLNNYILMLNKRLIDYQYFRKKYIFRDKSDIEIFKLIFFRDQIIFKKIFKD